MANFSAIRSIWFDLDDTLYDFQAMMRCALEVPLECIHRSFPDTCDTLNVEKMIRVREDVSKRCQGPEWTLERVRLQAFRETLEQYAQPDETLADELQKLYLEARFAGTQPYDDVVPCLITLRRKFPLGLLSNGNSRAEQIGLEQFFSYFVLSEQVGLRKPDARIFNHAAQLAGNMPEQCLYVGDSPEHDIVGALEAGWQAVWLNRNAKDWPLPSLHPSLQIQSLAVLPQLLNNI